MKLLISEHKKEMADIDVELQALNAKIEAHSKS